MLLLGVGFTIIKKKNRWFIDFEEYLLLSTAV